MGDKGGTVIYLEYESFRVKYRNLQEKYDEVLTEKEKLLTKAMPSATRYDKESVKCNSNGNPNEDYVISLEEQKIDEKLEKLEKLISVRERLISMKNILTKKWFKASVIRAIKTIAQTAIATIGTAVVLSDVNWVAVVSASVLAGILSILTSLAGLPEVDNE